MDGLKVGVNGKGRLTVPVWLLVAVDVFLVNAGFFLTFWVRYLSDIPRYNLLAFYALAPWITVSAVVIFVSIGLYSVKRYTLKSMLRLLAVGVVLQAVATMAGAFWIRQFAFPRSVLALAPGFQLMLLVLWRGLVLQLERRFHGVKQMLIVGYREDAGRLLPKVLALPTGWFSVAAVVPPEKAPEAAAWGRTDAVLLTEKVAPEDKREIMVRCFEEGRDVFVVPGLYEMLVKKGLYAQLQDTPVLEVPEIVISPVKLFFKRAMDVVVSLFALLVSMPLFAVIAVLIKTTSPGPVFYLQERIGCQGREFKIYKFRSMVDKAEEDSGPVMARAKDQRITGVGRILRAARLDELPQFVNILKGDMSLVGPRPERRNFVAEFLLEIPEYRYRYLVKPGLTGLAQVRSRYSTTARDKLSYDLNYIINYSLLLDFKIMLETIPTLFSREVSAGFAMEQEAAAGQEKGKT